MEDYESEDSEGDAEKHDGIMRMKRVTLAGDPQLPGKMMRFIDKWLDGLDEAGINDAHKEFTTNCVGDPEHAWEDLINKHVLHPLRGPLNHHGNPRPRLMEEINRTRKREAKETFSRKEEWRNEKLRTAHQPKGYVKANPAPVTNTAPVIIPATMTSAAPALNETVTDTVQPPG